MRESRLEAEENKINEFVKIYQGISIIEKRGFPPEFYRFEFNVKGYLDANGTISDKHTVLLEFPKEYPFVPPRVSLEKRVFHPNIYATGDICYGYNPLQCSVI